MKDNQRFQKLKATYCTRVEDKYVFNVSLVFWHIFIALSTLAIAASIVVLLWSLIPASKSDVEKKAYPAKKAYPSPVKIGLNDLLAENKKDEAPPVAPEQIQTPSSVPQQVAEDTNGKPEYEASMNTLKTLIPPAKYSWQGAGYYYYPMGERYWQVYKQEKYRQWISTEPGLEDKLKNAYRRSKAEKYPEKKQILDAYIGVVKILPEDKRLSALLIFLNNVFNDINQNITLCQGLTKVVPKMPKDNISYISQLVNFFVRNRNDGGLMADYLAAVLDKFDPAGRSEIIDRFINGYYSYFGRNFSMFKEATDLYVNLLAQIKPENQATMLNQYYVVFRKKNYTRDNEIAKIENEYREEVFRIDNEYQQELVKAEMDYLSTRADKEEYRMKSIIGIGGGIMIIVSIALVLVFFSIQRSVKKIEEKIVAAEPETAK